mmetsp:Transcript_18826/g.61536  ORF Transcript_18826/g.61536 Transcript_18826/m.61536 type:complete len:361 (-) Transcript_18826:895-1977(-)
MRAVLCSHPPPTTCPPPTNRPQAASSPGVTRALCQQYSRGMTQAINDVKMAGCELHAISSSSHSSSSSSSSSSSFLFQALSSLSVPSKAAGAASEPTPTPPNGPPSSHPSSACIGSAPAAFTAAGGAAIGGAIGGKRIGDQSWQTNGGVSSAAAAASLARPSLSGGRFSMSSFIRRSWSAAADSPSAAGLSPVHSESAVRSSLTLSRSHGCSSHGSARLMLCFPSATCTASAARGAPPAAAASAVPGGPMSRTERESRRMSSCAAPVGLEGKRVAPCARSFFRYPARDQAVASRKRALSAVSDALSTAEPECHNMSTGSISASSPTGCAVAAGGISLAASRSSATGGACPIASMSMLARR